MAELKWSCPKCDGHIAYPRELAGQAIACPHCGEGVVLPKLRSKLRWIVAGSLLLVAACVGAVLVWKYQPRHVEPTESRLAAPARPPLEELQEQAAKGDAKAQLALGFRYYHGNGVPSDRTEAAKWWRNAAERAEPEAMFQLGLLYTTGKAGADSDGGGRDGWGLQARLHQETGKEPGGRFPEGLDWYRKAAALGHTNAQLKLGYRYAYGYDAAEGNTNQPVVRGWLRKLADEQNAEAMYCLGLIYSRGLGVPEDIDEAARWGQKAEATDLQAANAGNTNAMLRLAFLYMHSHLVSYNLESAISWYRKAAELGNAKAMRELGCIYLGRHDMKRNDVEAIKWYRKAAESGDIEAMRVMGTGRSYGSVYATLFTMPASDYPGGPLRDRRMAVEATESLSWLRRLAEMGDAEGMKELGHKFKQGDGVAQDDNEAVKWYTKAAELADKDAEYILAESFRTGIGVERSDEQAVRWLTKAAEDGHYQAAMDLGFRCCEGKGTQKSSAQAFHWFQKAARADTGGKGVAEYLLGLMYAEGDGVKKDAKEAVLHFESSASVGFAKGEWELARAYEAGVGVLQDLRLAFKWYSRAATQGHMLAQGRVGQFYAQSDDSPLNRVQAHKWLSLAAAQGDEAAAGQRNLVATRMPAKELAEASRQAKAFQPKDQWLDAGEQAFETPEVGQDQPNNAQTAPARTRTQVPGAAVLPVARSTGERPAFEVLSVSARVTEQNDSWWRFGYRLTVRNNGTNAQGQWFQVQFLDAQGFVIDTTTTDRTVVKPGTTETVTGDALVSVPGAGRVKQFKGVSK